MNTQILITEIEAAINYWRQQKPSVGEELRLCKEASALANHYALMIVLQHKSINSDSLEPVAQAALQRWRESAAST